MISSLISRVSSLLFRPPDKGAKPPFEIHWADQELFSNGKFLVENFADVVSWIQENRKSYPNTEVFVASANGYIYRLRPDQNKLRFIRHVKGHHAKQVKAIRKRATE